MSIGLTAKELASIRTDINDLLPDTGYILNSAATADGFGGQTESWGTAGTVSYRLDSRFLLSNKEMIAGAALEPFHTFTLTLPYDTAVTEQNRFKDKHGNSYSIVSVDTTKSWIASVRCQVEII